MNIKRLAGMAILTFAFIMGCSGSYGKVKSQSESDSMNTQKDLINNWSDYDIRFKSFAIVFDPKNDNRKILLGGNWETVNDQDTWTDLVKANTTDQGEIRPKWANHPMTRVREIWGPDNQLYGYVIHQQGDGVSVKQVDENNLRLWYTNRRSGGGGPAI